VSFAAARIDRQLVSRPRFRTPAEVVAWFGAMQAQEYLSALWALGLRTPRATEATIEAALADGSVIRTHAFRWTWQVIAREDVRWVIGLVGARGIARAASRFRQLDLDDMTLARCGELFAQALAGGKQFTRVEMAAVLARGKLPATEQRFLHILGHAELAGVICSGARRGKQPTFALLDERIPAGRPLSRERALAELVRRYFQSRGPATLDDFVWWTGLTKAEARAGIEAGGLGSERAGAETYWFVDGRLGKPRSPCAHLLPAFDEYLVGYRDRGDVLDPRHTKQVNAGGGILKPAVVVDGLVIGTWKRVLERARVTIAIDTFDAPTRAQRAAIGEAAERYAAFVGLAPHVTLPRR
jgi:hypothetical protein